MRKIKAAWATLSTVDTVLGLAGFGIPATAATCAGVVMTLWDTSPWLVVLVVGFITGLASGSFGVYVMHRIRREFEHAAAIRDAKDLLLQLEVWENKNTHDEQLAKLIAILRERWG